MSRLLEINEQMARLQQEADAIRQSERQSVIDDILAKMETYGLSPEDLSPAGKSSRRAASTGARGPVTAKYRGPNGELWTGRGMTPRWLKALLDQGHNKASFLIA